jgi:hypothetical protein
MNGDFYLLSEPDEIKWFKSECHNIKFIGQKLDCERHHRTDSLIGSIGKLNEARWLFQQDRELIGDLWTALLGKAIIFLKYMDNRELYHDDEDYGVNLLSNYYDQLCEFERLLYGAEERYRDHMVHMLGVFLAGEYIIRKSWDFKEILVGDDLLGDNKITSEEKEAMWCVMALTHDLGISLEKIPKINEQVREMLKKFGVNDAQGISYPLAEKPLDELTIKLISSDLRDYSVTQLREGPSDLSAKDKPPEKIRKNYVTHLQSKYYMKFSDAYQNLDHGIISCLLLTKNLVYFLESDFSLDDLKPLDSDDAKQFLIRRNILRAVASHSYNNVYFLDAKEFPFLLRLFDEVHERERPMLIDLIQGSALTKKVMLKLKPPVVELQVTFGWPPVQTLGSEVRDVAMKEVPTFFTTKCEKIQRILRSAVGGENRHLNFTFKVINELKSPVETYYLVHERPDKIDLQMPSLKET